MRVKIDENLGRETQAQEKSDRKYKFRETIAWGVLEDLGCTLGEIELNLKNVKDANPLFLRNLINAMLLKGPKMTKETSPEEFMEYLNDMLYFLELGRKKKESRESFKQKRSPNV